MKKKLLFSALILLASCSKKDSIKKTSLSKYVDVKKVISYTYKKYTVISNGDILTYGDTLQVTTDSMQFRFAGSVLLRQSNGISQGLYFHSTFPVFYDGVLNGNTFALYSNTGDTLKANW